MAQSTSRLSLSKSQNRSKGHYHLETFIFIIQTPTPQLSAAPLLWQSCWSVVPCDLCPSFCPSETIWRGKALLLGSAPPASLAVQREFHCGSQGEGARSEPPSLQPSLPWSCIQGFAVSNGPHNPVSFPVRPQLFCLPASTSSPSWLCHLYQPRYFK